MKIWNDKEVKDLFTVVEDCKKSNASLKLAFATHAKKYNRKPNSVRNYYYKEVENLKKNAKRSEKLEISLDNHKKNHFVHFTKSQENKLLEDVDALVAQGMSVRNACKKLGGNDLTLMTRLQNKYQNSKKKGQMDNVIVFKNREKLLTENDINSLFMGLVKLIRKTAVDEFMEKTKLEKESSSYLLKKAFADLNKKDRQIALLREDFENLKKENTALVEKLNKMPLSKNEILKSHIKNSQIGNLSEKIK
jgi:hypothetical protein